MKRRLLAVALSVALGLPLMAETAAEKDARMKWWDDASFGIFITWGLYSIPAGVWEDGRVCKKAYGEWIMEDLKIPMSRYERLADQWNPQQWDPEKLVLMAKAAGMKYLVFVTKFHDGLSMFDTQQSPYSVVKVTPWKHDAFRALAAACHKHGLKLMPYYSIMDWHHPAWEPRPPFNDTAQGKPDMDRYVAFMKAQLTELQQNYGGLSGIWFDGNWEKSWTEERGRDLDEFCRRLIPGAILNNRVGMAKGGVHGIVHGDFATPEEEIPPNGMPGVRWESAMTMNETWGYRKDDTKWKTPTVMIRMLIDCASKGGNLLLNVGPTADGVIPEPSVMALEQFASWMKVNAEAIQGTTASPFAEKMAWGRVTQKPGRLYLHVFEWPADGMLTLPISNPVKKARVLGHASAAVKVEKGTGGIRLILPQLTPDAHATVLALEITGQVAVVQ